MVETGTGKRDNSLLWVMATAGSNRSGICYEVRTFVTRLLDRVFNDDSQFWIVYGHDDGDDWTLEESLIKANPNWGISVRPDVLIPLQAKAMQMPRAVNNFKTKRLNEWGNADTAWMDMRVWDCCADATLDLDAYAGEPCWMASIWPAGPTSRRCCWSFPMLRSTAPLPSSAATTSPRTRYTPPATASTPAG